jgi:phosphoglucomutase
VTAAIESAANHHLQTRLRAVKRMPHAQALLADTTHTHDYRRAYVAGLGAVLDMEAIRSAGLHLAVDPMGGAGVHYWGVIAERYRLNLDVISTVVDPTFAFMTLDWDGQIRMDPSSPYAMQRLIALKDRYDIAFACDTDHDRHGIVTPTQGLLPPNHFLVVAIDYLFTHRPLWPARAGVGKTMVSTQLIDRVAARLKRPLWEVPVGFKWFAPGLLDGSLGFAGEESAGASFLRRDGTAWTTDKDGIASALLAAEITARTGQNPGTHYARLARESGEPAAGMRSAAAAPQQKQRLAGLSARAVASTELAGEAIASILTQAPGNGQALGGVKVSTATGWFAARPSGTENIYKIYAESFRGEAQLKLVLQAAQGVVDAALLAPAPGDLQEARSGSEQTAD